MGHERIAALSLILDDLRRIFGARLQAVVAYGSPRAADPQPTLALTRSLTLDDLDACAARVAAWGRAHCATPLLLTHDDFARSLDAFPIEYGEIMATARVVFGADPFDGLAIAAADLRRACEVQAKSHLLHLREDYLESGGRRGAVDALVRESAPAVAALIRHLARLDRAPADQTSDLVDYAVHRIGLDGHTLDDLLALATADGASTIDTNKLFPRYLATMERITAFVDSWPPA